MTLAVSSCGEDASIEKGLLEPLVEGARASEYEIMQAGLCESDSGSPEPPLRGHRVTLRCESRGESGRRRGREKTYNN